MRSVAASSLSSPSYSSAPKNLSPHQALRTRVTSHAAGKCVLRTWFLLLVLCWAASAALAQNTPVTLSAPTAYEWEPGYVELNWSQSDSPTYHYDGRGNVAALSDGAGVSSGRYAYDAFGNTISQTGGAAGLNPYRFSTKEQIGGLIYYGYRFYAPSMSKWINRDPIEESGGVNMYRFVNNDPANYVDSNGLIALPSWLKPWDLFSGIVGMASIGMAGCSGCRENCQKCCLKWAAIGLTLATAAYATKIFQSCGPLMGTGAGAAACVAAFTALFTIAATSIALSLKGCMARCAAQPPCCKGQGCG